MLIDLANFVSQDSLPHHHGLLSVQQSDLLDYLLHNFQGETTDYRTVLQRIVRALILHGDSTGAARLSHDGGGTILANWLRSEINLASEHNPDLGQQRLKALEFADRLDFVLLALHGQPQWNHLFSEPHPSRNRLIHFQLSISGSPAYNLVAAKLNRGICAKTIQLRHLDSATFKDRLGNYVRPLTRIVRSIPKAKVRKSLSHYGEGEMDEIIRDVVNSLPRISIGPDGQTSYAPKTLNKILSTWCSTFYGTAADRHFLPKKSKSRRQTSIDPIDSARVDELSRTHVLRKSFHEVAAEQEHLEAVELNYRHADNSRRNTHHRNPGRGLRNISAGKAPIIFSPSRTMKGSLPLTSIALIMRGLERLKEVWTESEVLTSKVLVELMLHTGRRPEWLLSMNVGMRPNSIHECIMPILSRDCRQIFHVPSLYISPPSHFLQLNSKRVSESPNDDDQIYEDVNWIHRVPLPGPMSKMMKYYLQERRCLLNRYPEAAASLGCSHEKGHLFLFEKDQALIQFGEDNIQRLLGLLSAHIDETISEHPDLTASHFSRTFDAYYASFGIRGIHRYYVSGRARHMYEMPLRYSRVSLADIAIEYSRAYVEFVKEIALDEQIIGVQSTSFPLKFSDEFERRDQDVERFRGVFFGSPRVASIGIMRDIVEVLNEDLSLFKRTNFDHHQKILYLDTITKTTTVMIGLLNGLRPFEIYRIKHKHLDLQNNRLAVIGKSRGKTPTFRHLPILPRAGKIIENLLDQDEMDVYPGTFLFRHSSLNSNKRTKLSVATLDQILVDTAKRAGWSAAPKFYALRRRFRSDMLKFGVDEPIINYLMGHEIIGQEPLSVYSELSFRNLDQQYHRAASELADLYGFMGLKGI